LSRKNEHTIPKLPKVPERFAMVYLAIEFFIVFISLPLAIYINRRSFGPFLIPLLLLFAVIFAIFLLTDPTFDRRSLIRVTNFYTCMRQTLLTFIIWSATIMLICVVFRPDLIFAFPRNNPKIWIMVLLLYPLLSVYPQEIIFRTFIFHRYQPLFPNRSSMIIASGISFGLAHLFFANWIAPLLSFAGGILFGRTYAQTSSTLLVSIEHAIWGNFIFTIGLGWYFYGGSIS